LEHENATLKAKLAAAITDLRHYDLRHNANICILEGRHFETVGKLEDENAALKAQAASTLNRILAAVTAGKGAPQPRSQHTHPRDAVHLGRG
jgi:hypothetical protein